MTIKEERDASCNESTCHAAIICKCGKRVWFACGKFHKTRPIYCKECTQNELEKLHRNAQFLRDNAGKTDEQIISYYLRRAINHE